MIGSDRRIALALGVGASRRPDPERIDEPAAAERPRRATSLSDKLRARCRCWPGWRAGCPGIVPGTRGACQQVVPHRAPRSGALGASGPQVLAVRTAAASSPSRWSTRSIRKRGVRNVGMYRMQVFSTSGTTGMHWHVHKTGESTLPALTSRLGRRMPVAVCAGRRSRLRLRRDGSDAGRSWTSICWPGFCAAVRSRLVRVPDLRYLRVPADCDFVIEGYVDPSEEKAVEGPFGDHTGFYSLEDRYPAFPRYGDYPPPRCRLSCYDRRGFPLRRTPT